MLAQHGTWALFLLASPVCGSILQPILPSARNLLHRQDDDGSDDPEPPDDPPLPGPFCELNLGSSKYLLG